MRFKAVMGIFVVSALMLGSNFTQAMASTIKLVTLGDSLTAGYELPAEDAFPAKLEKALKAAGHDVAITNASVSGDTSADGLARADWSIAEGTDGVILELGANDALRGLTPEDTEKNLDAIIAQLKERKIAVLLAGMQAPPNMGPDYASRFNAIFPALAKKYDLTLYPLFVEAFILHPELKLADGMHPNAKGVDAAVAAFLPVAERFLGEIDKR
jgi:acyl-CoA thioesterase I